MKIIEYDNKYFNGVFEVIHKAIEEIYPKYYPRKAVDFFHNHHSKEKLLKSLSKDFTKIITENNKVIGTGSANKNNIERFFINPKYQNKGCGKLLLSELEKEIARENYKTITLDSSLGAVLFYKRLGYKYKDYKIIPVENNENLCYIEMIKEI